MRSLLALLCMALFAFASTTLFPDPVFDTALSVAPPDASPDAPMAALPSPVLADDVTWVSTSCSSMPIGHERRDPLGLREAPAERPRMRGLHLRPLG